ncbi:hypothetical protein SAMN05216379_1126 [Nitrosomonas eutropha]|nr:hypothetical protein SAMN05216379_1126 [Nitrosomonas eutropha]
MHELLTILRESPEPFGRLYEAILMRAGTDYHSESI